METTVGEHSKLSALGHHFPYTLLTAASITFEISDQLVISIAVLLPLIAFR